MDLGSMSPEVVEAYDGLTAVLAKVTKETNTLARYQKQMLAHQATLEMLNSSFNQVQSRLERIAAVKPKHNMD